VTVYKAGALWKVHGPWTWRLGYSYGKQPIRGSEVLLNILAPGVVEQHLAIGFTRQLASGRALSFALTRVLSHGVSGPNPLDAPGAQQITLRMDQWNVQLGYSWGL
jgi:long-chain fatty acid transport protein